MSLSNSLPHKIKNSASSLQHLAIIMDGNGRWAQARGLPRIAGHEQGAEAVRRAVSGAIYHEIRYLTLYGFSSENWNRPAQEVQDLMGLLRIYLQKEVSELHDQGVQLKVIGERQRLDPDIVHSIKEAEQETKNNEQLLLTIALSYGSRDEITHAVQNIAKQIIEGNLVPEEICEDLISEYLYTKGIPDPDLLIRTSGEQRISNFLLWQLAYAEFVFLEHHWPDFSKEDLTTAIETFQMRERRYGATTD